MKCVTVLLAILILATPAFSQQRWERVFGGSGRDQAFAVVPTRDGGYAVAGFTGSFGPGCYSPYLIKTDARGDTVWSRCYGGPNNDYCWSLRETRDGGFILAGAIDSIFQTGPHDVYVIKTNAQGDTLWSRVYGDTSHAPGKNDVGKDVQQTLDGGYVVVGSTSSYGAGLWDVFLIRTNAQGDTLWTRTYGGSGNDYGYAVFPTRDSGFVIAGTTDSYGAGGGDVYLVKTNARGDTLWTRTYGGGAGEDGNCVQQASDGGYIIAGSTSSFGAGGSDAYLVKTDAQGVAAWAKTFGGAYPDLARSVQQTSDGGYIVAGQNRPSANPDECYAYLIKTNAQGDSLWSRRFSGSSGANGTSVRQAQDGGYIIGAITWASGGNDDYYLIKADASGSTGMEEAGIGDPRFEPGIMAIPNPFTFFASVPGRSSERFALYDISGRKVGLFKGNRIGWDVPPGVYFLRPESKDARPSRIVKLR